MPNTSMIDGIEGIKPSGTQMKNGIANEMPNILSTFLIDSTKRFGFFN